MTTTDGSGRPLQGPLGGMAVLVVVCLAMLVLRELASLLAPLLFGGFLALVAWPLVIALERRGWPRSAALAATIAILLVLVAGSAAIIALSIGQLVALLPGYESRFVAVIESGRDLLRELGVDDPEAILALVSPEQVAGVAKALGLAASGAAISILIVVLTMAYALVGGHSLAERARVALGAHHRLIAGAERFGVDLRRYLIVRAVLGLFAAVLVFGLLIVLRVPLPLLWAFLVFAASFIPNVGVIVALIPPTLLALLDSGPAAAVAVVVGYTLINFAQDNVVQPVILGTELNLTPLVVFVAVVVWAWILGAAGALLAVPLTVGVVAILEAHPASRGLAALMRNRVDAPAGIAPERTSPNAETR